MSPHGSKLIELIRFLANRFLSDAQRKKIKNGLARLQQIPVKLLGLQSLIQAQQDEIARLKSRVTILDGKLNIALYGMPQISPTYQLVSLGETTLDRYVSEGGSKEANRPSSERGAFQLLIKALREVPSFKMDGSNSKIHSTLIFGVSDESGVAEFTEQFLSLNELYLVDYDPTSLENVQKLVHSASNKTTSNKTASNKTASNKTKLIQIEKMATTPMTALMALGSRTLDLIVCMYRFEELAPIEQAHFLSLAIQRLSPGGQFFLLLPDLSNSDVRQDLYWENPRNLRPYSMTHIRKNLEQWGGEFQVVRPDDQSILIVFRKEPRAV